MESDQKAEPAASTEATAITTEVDEKTLTCPPPATDGRPSTSSQEDMPTLLSTANPGTHSVTTSCPSSIENIHPLPSSVPKTTTTTTDYFRRLLIDKPPDEAIKKCEQLHSLLAKQIEQQQRLEDELNAARSEAQRLRAELTVAKHNPSTVRCAQLEGIVQQSQSKVAQLQQEVSQLQHQSDQHKKKKTAISVQKPALLAHVSPPPPSTVIHESPPSQQQGPASGAAVVAGLPPVKSPPVIDYSRLPGKAPPLPPSQPPKAPAAAPKPPSRLAPVAAALMKALGARTAKPDAAAGANKRASPPPPPEGLPKRQAKPTHNRMQLFWNAPTGSPVRVSGDKTTTADMFVAKQGAQRRQVNEDTVHASPTVVAAGSVFEPLAGDVMDELKGILTDQRLEAWFTKKPAAALKKPTAKDSTAPAAATQGATGPDGGTARRPSCLGAAASQKYHITVRCFRKEFDSRGGWQGFKRSILQCELTKPQIGLLLETIPDRGAGESNRKVAEWDDAVARVMKLRQERPMEPLYEDEEFVYYLSTIPDLHRRLSCMLIMTSFDELVSQISGMIETLMDGLEAIARNTNFRKLFQAILLLGNYFNEGTTWGAKQWFRISTLQKVADFRGAGRDAKTLMHVLASHLGELVTSDEATAIHKAAQVTIVTAVNHVRQVEDIFAVLSEETQAAEHLMKRRRRNSIMPGQADTNDRFAEVGSEFVRTQQSRFLELQQDLNRLLWDYKLCAMYFGDVDAFIPIDRKIEDEKNPGQQRYAQDILGVFSDWLRLYNAAFAAITEERRATEKKSTTTTMDRTPSRSAGVTPPKGRTPSSIQAHQLSTLASRTKMIDAPSRQFGTTEKKPAPAAVMTVPQRLPAGSGSGSPATLPLPKPLRTAAAPPLPIFVTSVSSDATFSTDTTANTDSEPPVIIPTQRRRASLRPAVFLQQPSVLPIHDVLSADQKDQYPPGDQRTAEETVADACAATNVRRRDSLRAVTGFLSSLTKPATSISSSVTTVPEDDPQTGANEDDDETARPFVMPPPLLPGRTNLTRSTPGASLLARTTGGLDKKPMLSSLRTLQTDKGTTRSRVPGLGGRPSTLPVLGALKEDPTAEQEAENDTKLGDSASRRTRPSQLPRLLSRIGSDQHHRPMH